MLALFGGSALAADVPQIIRDAARETVYARLYENLFNPHFCTTAFTSGGASQSHRFVGSNLLTSMPFRHAGFFGDQSSQAMKNQFYQYTQIQARPNKRVTLILSMAENSKMYPVSLEWEISFSLEDFVSAGLTPDNRMILFARDSRVHYVQRSYVASLGLLDLVLGPLGLVGSAASGYIKNHRVSRTMDILILPFPDRKSLDAAREHLQDFIPFSKPANPG